MTLGKIETLIESIKTRFEAHMATGGNLGNIKHLWVGDRPLSGGTDLYPAIIIDLESGSTTPTTQAYDMGENTLNMVLNIRLLVNKLTMGTKNSYAQNVMYDDKGNGLIPLMQYVIYAMMYDSSDNYSPIISSLDKLPMPRFVIRQQSEFFECEISYDLALRYVYEDIIGG